MKILFLTPWYPDDKNPHHGIFIRHQAVALSAEHDVWVISGKVDYSKRSKSEVSVKHTQVGSVKETHVLVTQSLPVINQLHYFYQLCRIAKNIAAEYNPDIIHGSIGYAGGVWSYLVSKSIKVPYVLTEHTRITNNFRSVLHKQLTLFAFKKASAVTVVSQSQVPLMKSYLKGVSIQVVNNILDPVFFKHSIISVSNQVIQIGFIGSLNTDVKGLDVLLHAVSLLRFDYVLHIAGAGSKLEEYKKLSENLGVANNCLFYGFVNPKDVLGFYQQVHFMVSSSRYETFGVSNIEAMACGRPVVATDSGGPTEYITEKTGLLVSANNPSTLADAITQMSQGLYRYNPQAIRDFVFQRFSYSYFRTAMSEIYNQALAAKKAL